MSDIFVPCPKCGHMVDTPNHELGCRDSEHHPLCDDFNKDARVWCICDRLRAAEQRERSRIRKGVLNLPVVGRLAGTDSTLAALHVLAVIDAKEARDDVHDS